jgi:hypothetical protein
VTVSVSTHDIAALGTGNVDSVNGQMNVVVLDATDVGATIDPSLLSGVSNLSGAEILTVEQAGVPIQVTTQQIADLDGAGGAVDSVNGQTGVVVLDAVDVGATIDPSLLSGVSNLSGAEILTVEQSGIPVQVTTQQIASLGGGGGGGGGSTLTLGQVLADINVPLFL